MVDCEQAVEKLFAARAARHAVASVLDGAPVISDGAFGREVVGTLEATDRSLEENIPYSVGEIERFTWRFIHRYAPQRWIRRRWLIKAFEADVICWCDVCKGMCKDHSASPHTAFPLGTRHLLGFRFGAIGPERAEATHVLG